MNPFGSFDVVGTVASSTTGYIVNFATLFEFMAGFILAIALIAFLVSLFAHRGGGADLTVDDTLMDV